MCSVLYRKPSTPSARPLLSSSPIPVISDPALYLLAPVLYPIEYPSHDPLLSPPAPSLVQVHSSCLLPSAPSLSYLPPNPPSSIPSSSPQFLMEVKVLCVCCERRASSRRQGELESTHVIVQRGGGLQREREREREREQEIVGE